MIDGIIPVVVFIDTKSFTETRSIQILNPEIVIQSVEFSSFDIIIIWSYGFWVKLDDPVI
jgi:hypothetical protein